MREPFLPSASRDAVNQAAAEWLAKRDADWQEDERVRFAEWLAADVRHAEAWAEAEAAWNAFDCPRQGGMAAGMVAELAARRAGRRRFFAFTTTGLAAAACLAVLFVAPARRDSAKAEAVASGLLSRPTLRALPDGSVIELNAGAEIDVQLSAQRRDVRLIRGEAHFTVAKDVGRPFVVTVGALQVQAVGTEFVLKFDPHAVDLLVTEGKVAVNRSAATAPANVNAPQVPVAAALVGAGGHLTVANGAAGGSLEPRALDSTEIERRLAWRGPRLELSATPLAEAIEVLNRENRVRIVVSDPVLREMRLSGVFRADNPDGFVRLLESHYGIVVERRSPNELHLRTDP